MATHDLKTWPKHFQDVWDRRKCFELRKDDRQFEVGDVVDLREYDPDADSYSGRFVHSVVSCVLRDFPGLQPGYCILGWWPADR